ncbi:MAG: anti-sigma-I factor RsgI family protein [Desulfotomaculales bacterium]
MARGLVIDKEDGRALVLTAEGEFRYVRGQRARAAAVGDTLALADRTVPRWLAAAAAALVLVALGPWQLGLISPAAAFLSVDMGPAVELALDRSGRIVGARGLGPEGRELFEGLNLVGLPAQRGLALLLERATEAAGPVVVGVTPLPGRRPALDAERVAGWVAEARAAAGGSGDVVVVPVSLLQRKTAAWVGVSPGRYVLMHKMAAGPQARTGEDGEDGGPAAARPTGQEAAPAGKASREEAGEPTVTGGPEPPGVGAPTSRPPVRLHPDTGGVPRGQTVPEKRLQELAAEREIVLVPGPRKAEDAPRTEGDKEPGAKGPRHARGPDVRNSAPPRGGGQGGAR